EHQNQRESEDREARPRAEPDELPAAAVLLDGHSCARATEQAATHVEIPAIEVSAPDDASAVALKRHLDCFQRRHRSSPSLAPDPGSTHPWKRQAPAVAPTPRRQTMSQAPVQPRQRL